MAALSLYLCNRQIAIFSATFSRARASFQIHESQPPLAPTSQTREGLATTWTQLLRKVGLAPTD